MPMNKFSTRYFKYSEISVNEIDLIEELYFPPWEIENAKRLFANINAEPAVDSIKNILRRV